MVAAETGVAAISAQRGKARMERKVSSPKSALRLAEKAFNARLGSACQGLVPHADLGIAAIVHHDGVEPALGFEIHQPAIVFQPLRLDQLGRTASDAATEIGQ